jgi:hypothetical protein
LSKNVAEIGDENRGEQKNDATPQLEIKWPDFRNVAQGYRVVKQMRCGTVEACCLFGYRRNFGGRGG